MFKKFKSTVIISLILCILMVFSSCGMSKSEQQRTSKAPSSAAQENKSSSPGLTSDSGKQNGSNPTTPSDNQNASQNYGKIIVSKNVSMETLTFDKAVKGILNDILSNGGYIENSEIAGRGIEDSNYVENRTANITARIPKDKFTNVSDGIEKYGTIIRTNIQSKNVTDQYYDIEARIKTQKVREERLLELLKKSGKLEDIITLENELEKVRLDIETLTGSIKNMDNLVEYSTLTITLREVKEPTELKEKPVTLWQKIKDGFISAIDLIGDFINNLLVIIAFMLPFALIILILYLVCRYVLKIPKKSKKNINKDSNKENNINNSSNDNNDSSDK